MWADWAYKWGCEVSESNLRLVDKYRDHAATWFPGEDYWQPGSWAVWDVIRNHKCNSDEEYDDPDEFMGVRREDPAADAVLMARDRARGFLVDSDTSEEGDEDDLETGGWDSDLAAAGITRGWAATRSHDNESGDAGSCQVNPNASEEGDDEEADDYVPEAYVGGGGAAAGGGGAADVPGASVGGGGQK